MGEARGRRADPLYAPVGNQDTDALSTDKLQLDPLLSASGRPLMAPALRDTIDSRHSVRGSVLPG